MDTGLELDKPSRARRGWRWVLVVLVAAAVYAATTSPLLGACLPYCFAAWPSIRTGWWISQNDPSLRRGLICFGFYLATACWRAAIVALLTVFGLMVAFKPVGQQPNMDHFAVTMLTLLGGVVLSTILGSIATIFAVAGRVRVWVHPRIRQSCYGDFREISSPRLRYYGFNYAIFVVATSLMFPILCIATLLAILVGPPERPNDAGMVQVILTLALFFGPPLCAILVYAWLSHRIIARSPSECWPIDSMEAT